MEKQIHEALNWRYAVQTFDQTKKLSNEQLDAILEAGRLAPSSFGLEAWKFIVVNDSAVRGKLKDAAYGQSKVTDASHLIVIARRTDVRERIVDERIARTAKIQGQDEASLAGFRDMLNGTIASRDDAALDTWIRSQTYIPLGVMMTTASLMHIDNAAMEGFDPSQVDEILGLRAMNLTATSMLALGYRGADPVAERPKVRREMNEVVQVIG